VPSLVRQAVKEGHRRIIVQATTGYGKTALAAHLIASAIEVYRRRVKDDRRRLGQAWVQFEICFCLKPARTHRNNPRMV
jgi:superfamily II DNA/RNA helicase